MVIIMKDFKVLKKKILKKTSDFKVLKENFRISQGSGKQNFCWIIHKEKVVWQRRDMLLVMF